MVDNEAVLELEDELEACDLQQIPASEVDVSAPVLLGQALVGPGRALAKTGRLKRLDAAAAAAQPPPKHKAPFLHSDGDDGRDVSPMRDARRMTEREAAEQDGSSSDGEGPSQGGNDTPPPRPASARTSGEQKDDEGEEGEDDDNNNDDDDDLELWDEEDELAQTLATQAAAEAAAARQGHRPKRASSPAGSIGQDSGTGDGSDGEGSERENSDGLGLEEQRFPSKRGRHAQDCIGGGDVRPDKDMDDGPDVAGVLARLRTRKAAVASRSKALLLAQPAPMSGGGLATDAAPAGLPEPKAAAQQVDIAALLARVKAKRQAQQRQGKEEHKPEADEAGVAGRRADQMESGSPTPEPEANRNSEPNSAARPSPRTTFPMDVDGGAPVQGAVSDALVASSGQAAARFPPAVAAGPQAASSTDHDSDDELEIVEEPRAPTPAKPDTAGATTDDLVIAHLERASSGSLPGGAQGTGSGAGMLAQAAPGRLALGGPGLRKTFGKSAPSRLARLGSVPLVNHGLVVAPASRLDSSEVHHAAVLLAGSEPMATGPHSGAQGAAGSDDVAREEGVSGSELELSGEEEEGSEDGSGSASGSEDEGEEGGEEAFGSPAGSPAGSSPGVSGDDAEGSEGEAGQEEAHSAASMEEEVGAEPLAFEEDEPEVEGGDEGVQAPGRVNAFQKMAAAMRKQPTGRVPSPKRGPGAFVEAEAELSEDEGMGLGLPGGVSEDEEEGMGDDVMLPELLGTAKEGAVDASKRLRLHQKWEHDRDDQELRQVVHAMRNGYKRPGTDRGALGGEEGSSPRRGRTKHAPSASTEQTQQDGTDADARRRRAQLFVDSQLQAAEEAAMGDAQWVLPLDNDAAEAEVEEEEEEAGGPEGDPQAAAQQREMRKRMRTHSLQDAGTARGMGLLRSWGSEEVQVLVKAQATKGKDGSGSAGAQGAAQRVARGAATAGMGGATAFKVFGKDMTNRPLPPLATAGPSFVGRAAATSHRSTSNMGAGKSFVFGSAEQSNSAAPTGPAAGDASRDGSGAAADASRPTTFAGVRGLLGNGGPPRPPRQPSGAKADAKLFKLLQHS